MVLALLLSLAAPAIRAADPPVRIRLNHEQFLRGDRARVYVEAAEDGYLVVLHADPFGRVRVQFPLDPGDDSFMHRGNRVEIRGRADRDAIFVDAEEGAGTVLAALSPDPFNYDAFVRGDHWDYRVLGATSLAADPLAGLLDIAQRMAGEARFEYDAATYVVGRPVVSLYGSRGPSLAIAFGYPYRFRLGFSYGYPYRYGHAGYPDGPYDPFCYDPFWSWGGFCRAWGFGHSTTFFTRTYGHASFTGTPSAGPRFVIPRERVTGESVQSRRRIAPAAPEREVVPRGREVGRESPAVRPTLPRSRAEARPAGHGAVSRGSAGASRGSARGSPSSGRGSGSGRR